MNKPRLIIIGLDCAPPRLIFDLWRKELPCLNQLISSGIHGNLRSSDPPITIPAWTSMLSGKSPAELGFYGFKTRRPGTYFEHELVTSQAIRHKRVWDYLADIGKKSILLGIPQTFPAMPINGNLVSCFLTPSVDSNCTYPPELKAELLNICPNYSFDVPHFRTDRKQEIFDALISSMNDHFKFFRYLLETKDWDFAMMVEIGTDRLQHCFWNDWDPQHPLHDPNSLFKNAMFDYYKSLDQELQKVVDAYGSDNYLMIVSDHGAKSMYGAIALNEWLIEKGYLSLNEYPTKTTPIAKCSVNWSKTKAWAEGGYFGRLYFNIEGREPSGHMPAAEYKTFQTKIRTEIESILGVSQATLKTKTFTAEELYGFKTAEAPDLFVYFDDLSYRCLGSIGGKNIACLENDMGPDGANHDYEGILIMKGPGISPNEIPRPNLKLIHVAATALACYGIESPPTISQKFPL